jgi:dienelactone hydrolase
MLVRVARKDDEMTIETRKIAYRDGDAELTGMLAWDSEPAGIRPGILVVHGGAGLDEHAQGRARGLAESGYLVFACDMYGNGVAGDRKRVMACLTGLRNDRAKLCARAKAGIEVLEAQPQVDGRVAAVGYCFGGMTVLELARSGMELAGVVSVHGSLDTPNAARVDSVKARILVCHGALDPHVPMARVSAFVEEMNRANANWQMNIYGGAMHGFTHQTGPYLPGVAYNAAADAGSSLAIKEFVAEAFRVREHSV